MNDLKWADVAHMYSRSGLVVEIDHPNMTERPCIRKSPIGEDLTRYTDGTHGQGWTVTPHLRHLEDMTEAEAVDLWNYGRGQDWINMQHTSDIYYDSPLCWYRFNRFGDINRQFTAKETYWLYKNGFDIHGLIESEQAIRKPQD